MAGFRLVVVSALCGMLTLWIFRRTTDLTAVRQTIKRVHAHLIEFRLFYDDPRLIWRAQKAVVRENLRFMLLMARPILIMTVPMLWLLIQFDSAFAFEPLPVGEPSVVTMQVNGELKADDAATALQAPAGILVETPPVRSLVDRQISWRIRPIRPVEGRLQFGFRGTVIDKGIAAGTRPIFLVRKRERAAFEYLLHPQERRLPAGEIDWIEVDYPRSDVVIAGIALPWMVWFVLLSLLGMILARRFRFLR